MSKQLSLPFQIGADDSLPIRGHRLAAVRQLHHPVPHHRRTLLPQLLGRPAATLQRAGQSVSQMDLK